MTERSVCETCSFQLTSERSTSATLSGFRPVMLRYSQYNPDVTVVAGATLSAIDWRNAQRIARPTVIPCSPRPIDRVRMKNDVC